MNKQEAIEKLQSESRHHCGERECYKDGCTKNVELDIAIDIVNQIDEPEQPILPQFIADYIASEQRSYSTLSEAIDNMDDEKEVLCWFYDNSETFAKAWLFGYEVEKEKLYTAELMSTGEYLHYDIEADKIHHFFAYGNTAKNSKYYHFTKSTLIQYNAWGNDAYDVNEVEE